MRVRSTGLGKTELIAQVGKFKRQDGHLVMVLESTAPVRWHMRVALTYKDIIAVLKIGSFDILAYLVGGVKTIFVTPPPPKDF